MSLPVIGFSIGDVNGIGPEVLLKALRKINYSDYFIPVIFGSSGILQYYKNTIPGMDLSFNTIRQTDQPLPNKINVINCWDEAVNILAGQITEEGGKYAGLSIQKAFEALKSRSIHCLVTPPIHKKAMELAGFGYPGHTEYFAAGFPGTESLMLLVQDELRVGVVTGHIPVMDIAGRITKQAIISKTQVMNQSLKMDFGIEKPLIAVLGLNPHAGDSGLFGAEEDDIIRPAISELKRLGYFVIGPFAADGFFGSGQFKKFHGTLAMYHDQGLIPFKTLSFGGGVNFTAGLPIIRTSPDHGTGFDIAGKNQASESSFIQAIYTALEVYRNRKEYKALNANKLTRRRSGVDVEDEIIMDEGEH